VLCDTTTIIRDPIERVLSGTRYTWQTQCPLLRQFQSAKGHDDAPVSYAIEGSLLRKETYKPCPKVLNCSQNVDPSVLDLKETARLMRLKAYVGFKPGNRTACPEEIAPAIPFAYYISYASNVVVANDLTWRLSGKAPIDQYYPPFSMQKAAAVLGQDQSYRDSENHLRQITFPINFTYVA
jgi:hypothetical protein